MTMDVTRTVKAPTVVYNVTAKFGRGRAHDHLGGRLELESAHLSWCSSPPSTTAGNRIVYGAPNAFVGRHPRGVVVRIQGVDAGFSKPNYLPGDVAQIHIATDEQSLTEGLPVRAGEGGHVRGQPVRRSRGRRSADR